MNSDKNQVVLSGELIDPIDIAYTLSGGRSFYGSSISSLRLSNTADIVPIQMSQEVYNNIPEGVTVGSIVKVTGCFRSKNVYSETFQRMQVEHYVYVSSIELVEDSGTDENTIDMDGYISKDLNLRKTARNKDVGDIMLACNRGPRKCDYIPCLLWGKSAVIAYDTLKKGDKINIKGRIQSRHYVKFLEDGSKYERTVNEVSIYHFEKLIEETEVEDTEE